MGLFSKKTVTCSECGKEFTTRIKAEYIMCDECIKEAMQLEKEIKGYKKYAPGQYNRLSEIRDIINHRAEILEKYCPLNGISKSELVELSDNYKKLSDEEAQDILNRATESIVSEFIGAGFSRGFFVPALWDGIVVDAEDVFAVTYTKAKQLELAHGEVLVCTLFTNDPYIPTFTMIITGEKRTFDGLLKRSAARNNAKDLFEAICPNLTYPVMELKDFANLIKKEDEIKGNTNSKLIKRHLDEVKYSYGTSNESKMTLNLTPETEKILEKYGYVTASEMNRILLDSGMFKKNFWKKQLKHYAENL